MKNVKKTIGEQLLPVRNWYRADVRSDVELDYIDIASVDRESKKITGTSKITGDTAPSRARQVVQANDILVSTVRPNLNAVAIVPKHLDGAIASTGFCVLRCDHSRFDHRYLFHWVRTDDFISQMVRLATGASYPAVSDRIIKESQVESPPLSEQRRIAEILDKADGIRRKREEAGGLENDLRLSVFREMFDVTLSGDENVRLDSLAEIVSGVAKGRKFNGQPTREVPYLRVANVQAGYLKMDEIKTIPATEDEIKELALQTGDVVMTEGGDHDKLGRGAIWDRDDEEFIHQNHVFRVRTRRDKMLPIVFSFYLQTEQARAYFLRCAKKTSNLASINMRQLRELPVPLPPLDLQFKFQKAYGVMKNVSSGLNQAQTKAGDLFQALVQRAFRGEL